MSRLRLTALALTFACFAPLAAGQQRAAEKPPPNQGDTPGLVKPPPREGDVPALAKPRPQEEAPPAPTLQLPTDPKAQAQLAAARDHVKAQEWNKAVESLQALLDLPEERFILVPRSGADGKETFVWSGARLEAGAVLRSLPAKGLEAYEQLSGDRARQLLDQAVKGKDGGKLDEVVRRYLWTKAGPDGARALAEYWRRQQSWDRAALCYALLGRRLPLAEWDVETVYYAARAAYLTGDPGTGDWLWKEVEARAGTGELKIGGRTLKLEEGRRELVWEREQAKAVEELLGPGPALYRGDPQRSGIGHGGPPLLEKRWALATFTDKATRQLVMEDAVKAYEGRNQAVLPAFFPIAAEGKLVYRSHLGIHALDIKTGKLAWEAESKYSLEKLRAQGQYWQHANTWVRHHLRVDSGNLLFENSALGTLSTDGKLLYAVEDLSVPPWTPNDEELATPRVLYGQLANAVGCNKLQAYNLRDGKLKWELGGEAKGDGKADDKNLSDTHFLGPPLPLGDKLYVLTERLQVLRLVCIDAKTGEVLRVLPLGSPAVRLALDWERRLQAAHLAYGQGVLVCPTNAGAVFGLDPAGGVLWVYPYREKGEVTAAEARERERARRAPFGTLKDLPEAMTPGWKVTAPVIARGKVVFAAPDCTSLRCLDLGDGSLLWSVPRGEDDLYLAGVFADKVVVVGKQECKAFGLADGKPAWRIDTGMPSGQGVAADGVYYLPLKAAAATKEPEVCAIDLAQGVVVAHNRSRKRPDGTQVVPGNLIFAGDDVLSQTVDEVACLPQLKAVLKEIDGRLGKDPTDAIALEQRGLLRLNQGNLAGAVEDLHAALAGNLAEDVRARVREKLFEALTDYLRQDFGKAEKYLDEYKQLCQVEAPADASFDEKAKAEAERDRRLARHALFVAHGREVQGKPVEALRAYLDLALLPGGTDDKNLIVSPNDPGLRTTRSVLVAGRIRELLERATPEQRKTLEPEIDKRWQELKNEGPDKVRRFLDVIGPRSDAGRAARTWLADGKRTPFVEAEQLLLSLRHRRDDPVTAARAVEALARMTQERGYVEDGVYWYRVLHEEFARVELRPGKTGDDLFNDLATDKRLLPFLDEPPRPGRVGYKVKEEFANFQQTKQLFTFRPQGELLPFLSRHRVSLELGFHQLRLTEKLTDRDVWAQNLTRSQFQHLLAVSPPGTNAGYPYHPLGHLVVLPLANVVFGIDPINRKVLWEKDLVRRPGAFEPSGLTPDKDGGLLLTYGDGSTQRVGGVGPVTTAAVCLLTREGLMGLDPLSGRTLWLRGDVSPSSRLFGDDQLLFSVETAADGKVVSTRAFRTDDGTTVAVNDFSALWKDRVRAVGRHLLVWEKGDKGAVALRLMDAASGKEVWKRTGAAGSLVLASEAPDLAGLVEPDGKVTVVEAATGKDVLKGEVDPKRLEKAERVTLLGDALNHYLAVTTAADSDERPGSAFPPGTRTVTVNGVIVAFDRDTGARRWEAEVGRKELLLDSVADGPALLLASLTPGSPREAGLNFLLLDKWGGKSTYDRADLMKGEFPEFRAFLWEEKKGILGVQFSGLRLQLSTTPE
jgi:outer membrane protein assembly factor BamB/tetratricopeptide (TPR) repeat protein